MNFRPFFVTCAKEKNYVPVRISGDKKKEAIKRGRTNQTHYIRVLVIFVNKPKCKVLPIDHTVGTRQFDVAITSLLKCPVQIARFPPRVIPINFISCSNQQKDNEKEKESLSETSTDSYITLKCTDINSDNYPTFEIANTVPNSKSPTKLDTSAGISNSSTSSNVQMSNSDYLSGSSQPSSKNSSMNKENSGTSGDSEKL